MRYLDNKNYITSFRELYHEVIDENNNVKACGREKCKELIRLAHLITGGLSTYGESNTGRINLDKMIELYSILEK